MKLCEARQSNNPAYPAFHSSQHHALKSTLLRGQLFVSKAPINLVLLIIAWFTATTSKMKYLGQSGTVNIKEFDCALYCRLRCLARCLLTCFDKLFFPLSINVRITAGAQHNEVSGAKVALSGCQRGINYKYRRNTHHNGCLSLGSAVFQVYRHCQGFIYKSTKTVVHILTDLD